MGNSREIFEFVLDSKIAFAGFSNIFAKNLALHTGDDVSKVNLNRANLAKFLGIKELKFMNQTHSDIVKTLKKVDDDIGSCDALITNLKDIGICVMVADCSPILLFDEKRLVIAAIHAGRAGVISRILSKTLLKMRDEFGSSFKDIRAFVGANIKGSCYEIANLDLGEFNKFKKDDKFDMDSALKDEFLSFGVDKFEFSKICTHCSNKHFSYRRDKNTGRFAGVIALRHWYGI